jgi:ubiquinone/menaquinone biosynthesis C-methylase UbiE
MTWSAEWDNVFANNEWGKYPTESIIRFIARNFYKKDRKNINLLEIGCGPAANVWFFSREGFNAYGIDGSSIAIDKAKQRFATENLVGHFVVGDIIHLPYEDSFFDAVVDNECLYCNNLESASKMLEEVRRVLRPGGLFYSRTFATGIATGKDPVKPGSNEYQDIAEGPLKGNSYARLSTRESIQGLYGKYLSVESIDEEQYSLNNGAVAVKEWSVICKKN